MLFSEQTPARSDLIDTLRRTGPSSICALAKVAARNYSKVHTDMARLRELGLVERRAGETEFVPCDEIDMRLPLAVAA
jgi:predicted transcriptional regulator